MTEMTQMTKASGPIARARDSVIGAQPSREGAMAEIPKETVLELKRSRLHGLEREVTRAVLTGAPREDIDEVIDTSLASDAEKAALRLYSWSLLSCFEAHRASGERRRPEADVRSIREIARSYREDRRIRRAKLPWGELESEAARQGCSPADIFFDRAGRSISNLTIADANPGRRDLHPEDTPNDPRSAMSAETYHRKEKRMTDKHDHPARPEQPGRGGFEEGQETLADDDRVGQFSDGNERLPDDERVGQFSDGNERLPDDEREGRFSDNVEADHH